VTPGFGVPVGGGTGHCGLLLDDEVTLDPNACSMMDPRRPEVKDPEPGIGRPDRRADPGAGGWAGTRGVHPGMDQLAVGAE
jgi:hypothetical protein